MLVLSVRRPQKQSRFPIREVDTVGHKFKVRYPCSFESVLFVEIVREDRVELLDLADGIEF